MKKFILAFAAMFTFMVSANAMSYEQARDQALFLTDKMAYELNLTDDQYEAAYEVNLDYLMSINNYDELYGNYWQQRNLDLSYILLDWQYRAFVNATYFYRPLYWDAGYWHFAIYARYPHRTYLYFGRPHFYTVYRGGHSWRVNGGRSWYHGRRFGGAHPNGNPRIGMRDGFHRGDYGKGSHYRQDNRNNRPNGNHNRFDGRPDKNNGRFDGNNNRRPNNNNGRFDGNNNRDKNNNINRPNNNPNGYRTFGNRQSSTRTTTVRSDNPASNNRTSGFGNNSNRRSFNNNSHSSIFGGNKSNNVTTRPTTTPNRSSVRNSSPRSFGGGNRSTTTTTRSQSRGGGNNGGGHFGGRR